MQLPKLKPSDLGRPKFRLRNPIMEGVVYTLRQPLYDVYSATVATALLRRTLFGIPLGGQFTPIGGAAQTKTEYHTNMDQAAQLQSPRKFAIKGVHLFVRPDIFLTDAQRFLTDTVVDVRISGKSYGMLHAHRFGGGGGIFSGSAGVICNGQPTTQSEYETFGESGEVIEQQQSIQVLVDPTLVADAAGAGVLTTAAAAAGGNGINAWVYLDGLLTREVMG